MVCTVYLTHLGQGTQKPREIPSNKHLCGDVKRRTMAIESLGKIKKFSFLIFTFSFNGSHSTIV